MTDTAVDSRSEAAPVGSPAAAPIAMVVALLLLAGAVVAGREFLIDREVVSGAPWVANSSEWLGRLSWTGWMLPAAIAAVALGALLLVAAGKPRSSAHLAVAGSPTLWLRPTDAARLSTTAAVRVEGVQRANSMVSARIAKVTVHAATDASEDLAIQVQQHVADTLAALRNPPKVRVVVQRERVR